jgi:hypothetical protein
MSYCPKCGAKVREEMNFCPKCGTVLKAAAQPQPPAEVVAPVPAPAPYRAEKQEKREKREKGEKREKQEKEEREQRMEKRESSFIGPLIGGIILVFAGFIFYLVVTGSLLWESVGALFFIGIGIIIIIGAIYAAVMATRRHPRP